MPLDGQAAAKKKQEQEALTQSMDDLQQLRRLQQMQMEQMQHNAGHPDHTSHIDQGANFPDSGTAVNPMRQFKWTGQQQVYRDNPRELWRANPQQLNSAGHSDGSLGDMSSAPDLGGAVGFDARGRTQPGS